MFDPFTEAIDGQTAAFKEFTTAIKNGQELPERAAQMQTVDVGQTPSSVVYEENKLELQHYEAQTDEQHKTPLLIVWSLINRSYILDLQPDRSVVRRLLEDGHDVYMISWNDPSILDTQLQMHDYVDRYIDNCVAVIQERSGQEALNLLGYCLGGALTAMYAARYPENVNSLGQIAGTLHFDDTGGVLERWGQQDHYDPEALIGADGNVPADVLATMFEMMDPVANTISKYIRLYENFEDEDFVENFARMERWLDEGIDVAGATYVEFMTKLYQNDELYRNELELAGEPVDITEIDMPVLQIVGEHDNLVPPEASTPFNDVVGSDQTDVIEFPTGHIGISVSSSAHEEYWPRVAEWFADHENA